MSPVTHYVGQHGAVACIYPSQLAHSEGLPDPDPRGLDPQMTQSEHVPITPDPGIPYNPHLTGSRMLSNGSKTGIFGVPRGAISTRGKPSQPLQSLMSLI